MIELKNLNKDMHIDYAEMLVKSLKLTRNTIEACSQIIITSDLIVLKDHQGRYLNSFSLKDTEKHLLSLF